MTKFNIIEDQLKNQFSKKYLAYALSTITQRALPDVRDGLKPVHRRLIYAMYLLNLSPSSSFKKSARVVGDVIGKFHPHGDQSVYDALVRLAQDFSTNYPLINGQGNFGNIDGDNAAAMRYTETKLTDVAEFLLSDIDNDTVEFRKTYDGELEEPIVLPSAFPNLLANGSSGIAVGMATNIPPHNLEEVCQPLKFLNNNKNASLKDLLKIIQGPDFPTGGILNLDKNEILKAYTHGKGVFELRSNYKVEDLGKGQYQIAITKIPYQVNKSKLIEKIADLIVNKKNKLLDNVIDESDENIRIVLRPKHRNVDSVILMNSLSQQTDLETKFFLNKINLRLEILKGFLIVYQNLNNIIKIIRNSNNPKTDLVKKYKFTENQVQAILDMKLRNLRKIEQKEIENENKNLQNQKKYLTKLLSSRPLKQKEINKEIDLVIHKFGNLSNYGSRKTSIEKFNKISSEQINEELKSTDPISIVLLKNGLLKSRSGYNNFKSFADFQENEFLVVDGKKSEKFIFLSNFGKAYTLNGEDLIFGSQKGRPFSAYFSLNDNEEIVDCFLYKDNKKIFIVSKNGFGLVIPSTSFLSNKKSGKKKLNDKKNDNLGMLCCLEKKYKFIYLMIKSDKNLKSLVLDVKEVPEQEKGSGVMLFKAKNYSLFAASVLNDKLDMLDSFANKIKLKTNMKSFITSRAKPGKLFKEKIIFNGLDRGFESNIYNLIEWKKD